MRLITKVFFIVAAAFGTVSAANAAPMNSMHAEFNCATVCGPATAQSDAESEALVGGEAQNTWLSQLWSHISESESAVAENDRD